MMMRDATHTTYFRHADGVPVPIAEAMPDGRLLRAGYGMRVGHSPRRTHDTSPNAWAKPILMHDTAANGGTKMQLNDTLATQLPGISGRTRQAIAALHADSFTSLESGLSFARDHLRQIKAAAEDAKPGTVNDAAVSQVADHLQAHIDAAASRLRGMSR